MEQKEKTKEIWKDVPGYEGYYQVSDFGRVKRLDRVVIDSRGGKRFYKGRIIKGSINKGYRQTTLRGTCFTFSQLVAMAFLGYKLNGHKLVVDHKNGNRSDDRVENLRLVSHRANTSTCFRKDSKSLNSGYAGVSWHKSNSKWRANIRYKGEIIYLGLFNTELEASEAYKKALAKIEDGTFNAEDYKSNFTSKHKGVYFNKASNKWVSRVRVNGKQKYLGIFKTELEAHHAYQKALKERQNDTTL